MATTARRLTGLTLAGASLMLAACGGPTLETTTAPGVGLSCLDDSWHCINQRQGVLKSMMADGKRTWVREPATPQAYASGVRLFAFRGKKRELSCDELAVGRREAEAAPGVLRGPAAGGLTPAQVSRSAMLAQEVSRELGREIAGRCKGRA